MRCHIVLSLSRFMMRSTKQHNMASSATNCQTTVFGTYHSILRDENPWQWHVTTGMFVVGFACTGILFVTGGWVTRLVILSWWPVSDIAMFLVEKYCRQKKGLPVTSALELSSGKVCQQLDTTAYSGDYQISSSPSCSTWDKTVFSDVQFLRQLDARFDDYSATIAEVLVLMRKNHSNLPRPKITADRCKVRLLSFQSVARIFSPTTVPQVDLLDMEERLARCLYLSDHTRLKVKVLYFWVVVVYRLHKHADLVHIIDRLDSMMAGTDSTQERYGTFCTREPHCVTQQAALRHDWVSLTIHVASLRANLNYQLTPICSRGGTELCAAYKADSVIERGEGSGCDVPVGVQSQQVASMDGENTATSCHILDDATTDGTAAALPLHDKFGSVKTDPSSLKNLF